jgi:hypothetical protein
MKLKHNKKRNTAFLYEVLVRNLAKATLEKDTEKKQELFKIIEKSFKKNTALHEELQVYKSVCDNESLHPQIAERIIFEAKKDYQKIDRQQVFVEQTSLIKQINKLLSRDAFSVFVPNYKSLATVYQIFNNEMPAKMRVLLEQKMIGSLCGRAEEKQNTLPTVDSLVLKSFIDNFNKTYSDNLINEQKTLLSKYIFSFIDNGIELKLFLNEEVGRLKSVLSENLNNAEFQQDEGLIEKIAKTINIIDSFKGEALTEPMLQQVLKIQSVVSEIEN